MRVLRTGAVAVWVATACYVVGALTIGYQITFPDKDISTWTRLVGATPVFLLGVTLGCGLWGFAEVLRTRSIPSPLPPKTDGGDNS